MPGLSPRGDWPAGRLVLVEHRSAALAGNPWNDPVDRQVPVYLPAAYESGSEPFISLWDLAAFTNSGLGHIAWRNHGETLPQRLDRLIGQGLMPPAVVVMPDCFTSLGGNQYVNSPSVGHYADYLVQELVPLVSERFNVVDHATGRGVFGKSSGGFGALFHAMHYPQTWGGVASHAADVDFELVYRPEFPQTCLNLQRYDGDSHRFIRAFWNSRAPGGGDFTTLMILALAASYDPDASRPGAINLPFDLRTCALDEERWQRWLRFDPLNLVPRHADALRGLEVLYLDVGNRDQYNIQFGTRRLVDLLGKLEIPHHFEEFDGNHSGMDWRLDHSLPFLAKRLKSAVDAAS